MIYICVCVSIVSASSINRTCLTIFSSHRQKNLGYKFKSIYVHVDIHTFWHDTWVLHDNSSLERLYINPQTCTTDERKNWRKLPFPQQAITQSFRITKALNFWMFAPCSWFTWYPNCDASEGYKVISFHSRGVDMQDLQKQICWNKYTDIVPKTCIIIIIISTCTNLLSVNKDDIHIAQF